jgi:PIN domain nuclease of toxin-antitoxin system
MNVLIDTQILIWWQLNDSKLNGNIFELLVQPENTIYVSLISLFEIAIKQKTGKLEELDVSIKVLAELVDRDGFTLLPVQIRHIEAYADIPLFPGHRDPFDRLLLATAYSEIIPIISADGNFELYTGLVKIIRNI